MFRKSIDSLPNRKMKLCWDSAWKFFYRKLEKTFCPVSLINHLNLFRFPSLLACSCNFDFCGSYLTQHVVNKTEVSFKRISASCVHKPDLSKSLITCLVLFVSGFTLSLSFCHFIIPRLGEVTFYAVSFCVCSIHMQKYVRDLNHKFD